VRCRDIIETNPAAGIEKPASVGERDRALTDDEIRFFWLACERLEGVFGPLFKFLLLTGQRRGECAEAVWPEFNLESAVWHLPGARTKNKRAHDIHLAPQTLALLDAQPRYPGTDLVFTATGKPLVGFKTARMRLVKIMEGMTGKPVQHFTVHDLRRTATTGMAGIGVAPHIISKIQNHSAGPISGVTAIYNRHEYTDERAVALTRWADHIDGLVKPRKGSVTRLRPRR
jgi:integrase